jgi:YegS/Rv2252/BmrU family lipid kinase
LSAEPAGPLVFLVNPASANGSTGRRWASLREEARAAGLEGEVRQSERPGHLTELAEESAREGAGTLVVVGGDGTVHEVVNGLMRSGRAAEVTLAVIPRGTGKDFARGVGIPHDTSAALVAARQGRLREVDVGLARFTAPDGSRAEAHFVNFAGAGISGAIARRANASSKAMGGRISFIVATITVFARWRAVTMTATVETERRSGPMFEVLAMNGGYTAGGMWAAPDARPDDGLLDVVLIGDVTKADFVRTFPKIYRGRHLSHPKIELLRGRALSVDSKHPLPVVLDGEQPGTTPAEFTLLPRALRVKVAATPAR